MSAHTADEGAIPLRLYSAGRELQNRDHDVSGRLRQEQLTNGLRA